MGADKAHLNRAALCFWSKGRTIMKEQDLDQWFIDMAPVVMAKTAELEAAGLLEPSEGDADALARNVQRILAALGQHGGEAQA
jgi:hypothetical protein